MKRPPTSHIAEVELDGIRYQGEYTIESSVVIVTYGMHRNQRLAKGIPADFIARQLLLEILERTKDKF